MRRPRRKREPRWSQPRANELADQLVEAEKDRIRRKAGNLEEVQRLAAGAIRAGIRPRRLRGWLISAPRGGLTDFILKQMVSQHGKMLRGRR